MALSARSRRKGAAKAAKQLGIDASAVRAYGVGHRAPRMTTKALVAAAGFGVLMLVALAFGRIIFPGGLLVLFVLNEVRPARAVAVTDDGVALFGRSLWNGALTGPLGRLPHEVLRPSDAAPAGSHMPVHFGDEQVN